MLSFHLHVLEIWIVSDYCNYRLVSCCINLAVFFSLAQTVNRLHCKWIVSGKKCPLVRRYIQSRPAVLSPDQRSTNSFHKINHGLFPFFLNVFNSDCVNRTLIRQRFENYIKTTKTDKLLLVFPVFHYLLLHQSDRLVSKSVVIFFRPKLFQTIISSSFLSSWLSRQWNDGTSFLVFHKKDTRE